MEHNSEVRSSILNDSVSIAASSTRYREEDIPPEEEALLQILQKGISVTTEENNALGKEISGFLKKLNIEQHTLPEDIKEGLHKMSSILLSHDLSDLDENVMSIVRERKKIKDKRKQREEKVMSEMHDNLFRKFSSFSKKLDHLQIAVNSLKDSLENSLQNKEDIYCDKILLPKKLMEYEQTVEKLEEDLKYMQENDLYPDKILNKFEQYLELSGELAQLNESIDKYKDLPPNYLQAKALLQIKQKEYDILKKAFLEKTNCA